MSRRKDTSVTDEYNKQKELEQLHRVFNRLDSKGDGKIDEQELGTYLRTYLGYKPKKGEVAEMIWQVDENGDGLLHWDEFSVMCAAAPPHPPKHGKHTRTPPRTVRPQKRPLCTLRASSAAPSRCTPGSNERARTRRWARTAPPGTAGSLARCTMWSSS